ncbi:unnamed protein product [Clonostachys rosea]|uniref:Uncharacterized protein n=1 Tax=Bionectria ochroleuca TaxID=29856 RepID=A0ABY6TYQ7_BIOOC|nr:unnamed protein product [Clonostachys rosea]
MSILSSPLAPRLLTTLLLLIGALTTLTSANVEKVIFLGPATVNIPLQKPTLSDLNLHTLTPETTGNTIRTRLARQFLQEGIDPTVTWLLLDTLTEGQRYELRVCWAALEPTNFALDVFELNTVWETPELIQSLAEYATSRLYDEEDLKPRVYRPAQEEAGERKSSVLLVRIHAVADYFTRDQELMRTPPPVLVDLTLDPFLYNILPRSLLPTLGYIACFSIITWFVARWVATSLRSFAGDAPAAQKKVQ